MSKRSGEQQSWSKKNGEGLCQLVKDREGLWWSRPFGNHSEDFGYKKYESQFWERPGLRCFSLAGANSWILNEICCCCCRNPPLRGLGLQNNKHKPLNSENVKQLPNCISPIPHY